MTLIDFSKSLNLYWRKLNGSLLLVVSGLDNFDLRTLARSILDFPMCDLHSMQKPIEIGTQPPQFSTEHFNDFFNLSKSSLEQSGH